MRGDILRPVEAKRGAMFLQRGAGAFERLFRQTHRAIIFNLADDTFFEQFSGSGDFGIEAALGLGGGVELIAQGLGRCLGAALIDHATDIWRGGGLLGSGAGGAFAGAGKQGIALRPQRSLARLGILRRLGRAVDSLDGARRALL